MKPHRTPEYELRKVQCTKKAWDDLVLSLDNPNVMQTWDYGQAMNEIGWTIERYFVFFESALIAFFQVFKRKYFYVTSVKIQRAPLFLNQNTLNDHWVPVLSIIRKKWNFWTLQFLQIEFELPNLPEYYPLICSLGFRKATSFIWESTRIDLRLSEENLLANMKANWRNSLKKSIKNNLNLHTSTSKEDYEWLLLQYDHFKKEKHIVGASLDLLRALHNNMITNNTLHVLFALDKEGQKTAAVIIVSHGVGSSYLLGWISESGKKLKAHNFLLWSAIKDAKTRGEHFFDLGGVLSSTPQYQSIADFKLGLNGAKYALIGRFY